MPINYSFNPGGASLQTDNPSGNELFQYMQRFKEQEAPRTPYVNKSIVTREELAARGQQGRSGEQSNRAPDMLTSLRTQAAMGKPGDYGKFMMNQHGNWGKFVDAADIPAYAPSSVAPGFYGGLQNWDTSNPDIQGHQAYGKTNVNGSGGGGNYGVSSVKAPDESSSSGFDYLPPLEQARYIAALKRG